MKKQQKLQDAIGIVGEDLIHQAKAVQKKTTRFWRKWYTPAIAAALVFAIVGGVLFLPERLPGGFKTLAEAEYPKTEMDYSEQKKLAEGLADVDPFVIETMRVFLEGETNKVYSPLNVYIALSMTAEVTDGTAQAQILDLLGIESMEQLREQIEILWQIHYYNGDYDVSLLANSLWLQNGMEYRQETMDILAEKYYASAFSGEMGSNKYNKALQDWINQQTGGLLKKETRNVEFSDQTGFAMVSSIYFRDHWAKEFSEKVTKEGIFHTPEGDQQIDFMYQMLDDYYWGEHYGAVEKRLMGGGSMWLILPDEGLTPSDLLQDQDLYDLFSAKNYWNYKDADVHLTMPKFDVTGSDDLRDDLKALGVTEVFGQEDFTFSDQSHRIVRYLHNARVAVDEDGVTAAAYTVEEFDGAADPMECEEIYFTLDRPFLFVITSKLGVPLFAGTVYQP